MFFRDNEIFLKQMIVFYNTNKININKIYRFLNCIFFLFLILQVGREVAHPGVANDFNDKDARKYYTYYQWVCFVLFFQVSGSSENVPTELPCERSGVVGVARGGGEGGRATTVIATHTHLNTDTHSSRTSMKLN